MQTLDKWRPEGWEKNRIHFVYPGEGEENIHDWGIYEAGADAMLEALRKNPVVINATNKITVNNVVTKEKDLAITLKGVFVFIPDDPK